MAVPADAEEEEFKGKIGKSFEDSKQDYPQPVTPPKGAPNVVLILIDDLEQVVMLSAAAAEGHREELEALPYPRYYLDFETIGPAVPIWAGTRPYASIPVQWSCHAVKSETIA